MYQAFFNTALTSTEQT